MGLRLRARRHPLPAAVRRRLTRGDAGYDTARSGGTYPLVLATYEIVCSKYADADTGKAVKAFLAVAASDGQNGLEDNGYIPLPGSFKDKLVTAINAIS